MEVAKMEEFAAAKKAAEAKGLGKTVVIGNQKSLWRRWVRPEVIVLAVLVVVMVWWMTRPGPPPAWTRFPDSPMEAAEQLVRLVAMETNESSDKAYALVPPAARDADMEDEQGLYRQLFLTMNHYLRDEFGADWMTRATFAVAKENADVIEVHIDAETLHVRTVLVTPSEKQNETNRRYGIAGISEFDVRDAAGFQKMGAISGVTRGYGGEGAVGNLQAVLAAGARQRESAMQTKLRLLPILRDPRRANGNRFALIQTWKVRQDPVIRQRLEMIANSDLYDREIQQTAKDVLRDAVPEEELIAAGVE